MGCSPSKDTNFIILPENVSTNPKQSVLGEKISPQSTRILENCLIIWFCNETSKKYEQEREQLRKIVYGFKTFTNIDGCIAFITSIQDEKIFLIISDPPKLVERFQYLSQIEKIYIFISSYHELNHVKNRYLDYTIMENLTRLSEQLQEDKILCELDLIFVSIVKLSSEKCVSLSNLTKQEATFLFIQMIKEIIYRLKFESGSKDVFIEFCRLPYTNSSEQLSLIDDFAKNYRPNKALYWLTKSCFISQILNRVLRTREIDIIYKLGFFIKQIHLQLNRLYIENELLMKNILIVYRGKTMSNNEFDIILQNDYGSYLSFSNFLIATTKKDIAIDFVHRRLAIHSDLIGVIFEIHIDHSLFNEKNPFALLKDTDMNKNEICFHMGTIFSIESIEQTISNNMIIWFVKLKLTNENDEQLRILLAPARNDEMHANPVSYLGKVLITMGEYRRAEQVLLGLLQDKSVVNQPRRLVRAHNGLGAVYTYMNDYIKALDHYNKTLETSLIYLQSNHPDLIPIYKAIGDTYFHLNNNIYAIENYEKAIELLEHNTQQINLDIRTDLHACLNKVKQSIETIQIKQGRA